MKKFFVTAAMICLACAGADAQQFIRKGISDERTKGMAPEMSEFYYPIPKVTPGEMSSNSAPSDAIILFDGKDLSAWTNSKGEPAGWTVNEDGTFTVNKRAGDIMTKESFGDFQLHIEWMIPEGIKGNGQRRGNSGVYLQNKYEIQILDSYENETYSNGQSGSIYKQSAPLANPSRRPGEWNEYDIIYTAPTFKADGTYRTFPTVTVIFNGVLVQNNTTIVGTTEYIGFPTVGEHGEGPILLQSHPDPSEPVSFRNIWIRRL